MVVTHVGANRQMEEELVTLKKKLEYLDQRFLDLHLQYSAMSNRQQRLLQALHSLLPATFVG